MAKKNLERPRNENGDFIKTPVIHEEHTMMADMLSGKKEAMQLRESSTDLVAGNINYADGKNSTHIRALMENIKISEGVDFSNVDDMRWRFYTYLKYCAEHDIKIGNLAAYSSFGCSKQLAESWLSGAQGKDKQEFIQEVRRICSAYRESMAQEGGINPAIAIFWAKNFDGLRDEPKESIAETSALGEPKSAMELAEKYADLDD